MDFKEYMSCDIDQKFAEFMDSRFSTNRTPSYWVKWDNVLKNMKQHELNLNTLNYLLGKQDIKEEAKNLFLAQPQLLESIPVLIASRDSRIDILGFSESKEMFTYDLDFKNPNVNQIDEYMKFLEESGLLEFLQNHLEKSLVDYVFGIQAGLDSNGRKNRSGTQNEKILDINLQKLQSKYNYLEFKTQATNSFIKSKWNINVPEPLKDGKKGGRRYDAAIYNPRTKKVTVVETNFYGGGGSKLKAVSGEFSDMYNTSLKDCPNVDFIWITDGPGWDSAKNPLREAFDVIPNVFNLRMIKNDFWGKVIVGEE